MSVTSNTFCTYFLEGKAEQWKPFISLQIWLVHLPVELMDSRPSVHSFLDKWEHRLTLLEFFLVPWIDKMSVRGVVDRPLSSTPQKTPWMLMTFLVIDVSSSMHKSPDSDLRKCACTCIYMCMHIYWQSQLTNVAFSTDLNSFVGALCVFFFLFCIISSAFWKFQTQIYRAW